MVARSYEEAQAEAAVEYAEIWYGRLEAARWQLAQLVSQPDGEQYLPTYERVHEEFLAVERQVALIDAAKAVASQPPPSALNRRSSRERRASV